MGIDTSIRHFPDNNNTTVTFYIDDTEEWQREIELTYNSEKRSIHVDFCASQPNSAMESSNLKKLINLRKVLENNQTTFEVAEAEAADKGYIRFDASAKSKIRQAFSIANLKHEHIEHIMSYVNDFQNRAKQI